MLQDVTSLHDAIILMPQSSRSRHQRTRFPRPHWVATAATAWQTAAVWYLVKHQTVRGFEQEEWISLKPGQIKTNQTASRSASWMCHDLTTSLTCFRTGWQSGFGWYGIFQARTEELILIVPFCTSPKNPFRSDDDRMTHWPLGVHTWRCAAVADGAGANLRRLRASLVLPVCRTKKQRNSQISNWKMLKMHATWAQDLYIELLFSSSWNWGISWWLPNLGSKVPCNPWSQIGHDMFLVMHKVIVSKYLQAI